MATVTKPIILDETGVAIKKSIDLLTANINRTADNIAYDSNLTIKGKIQAIDLTSGGTIEGNLKIDRQNANSELELGNSTNSRGVFIIFSNNDKYSILRAPTDATSNCNIYLPDKVGTIALTSDINGAASSRVDFTPLSTPIFTKESISVMQVGNLALVNLRLKAVSALSAGSERDCGTLSNLLAQGYIAGIVNRNNNSKPTGGFVIPSSSSGKLYIYLTENVAQNDIVNISLQAFVS